MLVKYILAKKKKKLPHLTPALPHLGWQLLQNLNAADTVMDLLNDEGNQEAILEHFRKSAEKARLKKCIDRDEEQALRLPLTGGGEDGLLKEQKL